MKVSIAHKLIFVLLATALVGLIGCGATNPIDAVNLNRQAQVYIKYARYDQARELLQSSLDADFENPASHYWLGHCYEVSGETDKAIEEYELAVRFGPTMEKAHIALISLLHTAGLLDQSIQATKVYLRHKGPPACNLTITALEFADKGMDHQAILTYQRAQEVEPKNPVPSIKLAEYYFDRDQQEKGIDGLVAAFMIDPLYPGLARRLGEHGRRVDIPEPPMLPQPTPLQRELRSLIE